MMDPEMQSRRTTGWRTPDACQASLTLNINMSAQKKLCALPNATRVRVTKDREMNMLGVEGKRERLSYGSLYITYSKAEVDRVICLTSV